MFSGFGILEARFCAGAEHLNVRISRNAPYAHPCYSKVRMVMFGCSFGTRLQTNAKDTLGLRGFEHLGFACDLSILFDPIRKAAADANRPDKTGCNSLHIATRMRLA